MQRLCSAALFVALAACSTAPIPQDDAPPLDPARSRGTARVTGTWSSPSCGDRAYERRIVLGADGVFTAEDRVAPCPPTARCFWSGIVVRRGTYSIGGGEIRLVVENPSAGPGQPLPGTLVIDATGAPVEVLANGQRCPYVRLP